VYSVYSVVKPLPFALKLFLWSRFVSPELCSGGVVYGFRNSEVRIQKSEWLMNTAYRTGLSNHEPNYLRFLCAVACVAGKSSSFRVF